MIKLLTAVLFAGITFPPCTVEQPLTPDQAALGAEYDAAWPTARLSVTSVVGGGSVPDWQYAEHVAPADHWRVDVRRAACGSPLVVSGTVQDHGLSLITPQRRYIWSEYRLKVDAVYRGAGLAPGQTITITRDGGIVCTTAGPYRAYSDAQSFLTMGDRYLLFLTPKHGRYATSDNDYRLTLDGAERADIDASVTLAAAGVISELGTTCAQ